MSSQHTNSLTQEQYNDFGRLGLQLVVSGLMIVVVGISFAVWLVGSVIAMFRGTVL